MSEALPLVYDLSENTFADYEYMRRRVEGRFRCRVSQHWTTEVSAPQWPEGWKVEIEEHDFDGAATSLLSVDGGYIKLRCERDRRYM